MLDCQGLFACALENYEYTTLVHLGAPEFLDELELVLDPEAQCAGELRVWILRLFAFLLSRDRRRMHGNERYRSLIMRYPKFGCLVLEHIQEDRQSRPAPFAFNKADAVLHSFRE